MATSGGCVRLARRSRGVTTVDGSEVRLEVSSVLDLPLEIPGLVSCRDGAPCPEGMMCDQHWVCREQ